MVVFQIEEFISYVQRGRFRVLPGKGADGKFLQGRRNRRMVGIKQQRVCWP